MAEDPQELRRINWSECFPFTHLFRTFRLAIHPTKLLLSFAALLASYCVGRVLDVIWLAADAGVLYAEAADYPFQPDFKRWHNGRLDQIQNELARRLLTVGAAGNMDEALRQVQRDWGRAGHDAEARLKERLESATGDDARQAALEAVASGLSGDERTTAEEQFQGQWVEQVASARRSFVEERGRLKELRPRGVFAEFLRHEWSYARSVLQAARMGEIVGQFETLTLPVQDRPATIATTAGDRDAASLGIVGSLLMMAYGFGWLITQHWLFAVIFLAISLAIWSVLGGAVCRVAAVHIARDEKVSARQAIRFAWQRKVSIFSAPLLPLLAILFFGFFLVLGGLAGAIPYVEVISGPVLSLLFGLALIAGLLIALLVVGLVGGGCLMWPTIAVEGSDSFDAISRSYSYVFAKPWRTIFYALLTLVYGAFCYLFVTVFTWLLLSATHWFVGLGTWVLASRPEVGEGMSKIDAIWVAPTLSGLRPDFESVYLEGGAEWVSAVLVMLWVYLLVGLTYAFLISFFFSGSTVAYFLLRREVDATDLEDVYPDEYEEEPLEVGPQAAQPSPPATEAAAEKEKGTPASQPAAAQDKPGGDPEAGG